MTAIFIVLALAVVGSFACGTIMNIRRGTAILRWMQGGLPRLGARTTVRWMGTTAVELVIKSARAPFEQVTMVVFLEPRDMPWMWGLARRRGRRDTLILRAQLRKAPETEIEALDPQSWSGREALPRVRRQGLDVREAGVAGEPAVHAQTAAGFARADALLALARGAGLVVRRLAVHRAEPHLQLHVAPPSATASASDFFETVRALGERAQGADSHAASVKR